MRENVRAFIATAAEAFSPAGPIYEFGAYQVEGQDDRGNLRSLFPDRHYVGCDMRIGPGVDRIEDLADLSLPDEVAKTVICVDTLEHVFESRRAVDEMLRVLAPGGLLLLSVPLDFKIHAYPSDYWRFTPSCLERLLAPLNARIIGSQGTESFPHTVFAVGCKAPVPAQFVRGSGRFVEGFQRWLDHASSTAPWESKFKRNMLCWLRSKGERRRLRQWFKTQFILQMQVDRRLQAESFLLHGDDRHVGGRLDLI